MCNLHNRDVEAFGVQMRHNEGEEDVDVILRFFNRQRFSDIREFQGDHLRNSRSVS